MLVSQRRSSKVVLTLLFLESVALPVMAVMRGKEAKKSQAGASACRNLGE